MRADRSLAGRRSRVLLLSALGLCSVGSVVFAAEAPPPVAPEAEAAYQDLREESGTGASGSEKQLDEAIFTEISALTIPEIGIALPPDQEH